MCVQDQIRWALVLAALLTPMAHANSEPSRSAVQWGVDINFTDVSGHPSWTNGLYAVSTYGTDIALV